MREASTIITVTLAAAIACSATSQAADEMDRHLNPDGSFDVKTFNLPFSAYASPEARLDMQQKFNRLAQLAAPPPKSMTGNPIQIRRQMSDNILFTPFVEAQRARYAVTMTEAKIGGVPVQLFIPKAGVAPGNEKRILIDLHGGGFLLGWGLVSQIESIPVSAVGGVKVISVNYRMFPEAKFPAASEDVASVYRDLLKTYKPSQIGIYGCSAGGILTSEVLAWFQKVGLPMPAAIAIWSAALDPRLDGDAAYISPHLGSYIAAPGGGPAVESPYFSGVDVNDPTVWPSRSKAVLEKYPPTLLLSGTRAGDMSSETHDELLLLDAGVDVKLALWDGLDHCFMYNPDMPESRQAYAMTVKFFSAAMDSAGAK